MKIIQYYDDNSVLIQTVIYKFNLIEKIKFILTGKITVIYQSIKNENIRHELKI